MTYDKKLHFNIHSSVQEDPINQPMYAIINALKAFNMTCVEALATFMYGISPGGGSSNFVAMYTGSNLELSVSLSILSNISYTPLTDQHF